MKKLLTTIILLLATFALAACDGYEDYADDHAAATTTPIPTPDPTPEPSPLAPLPSPRPSPTPGPTPEPEPELPPSTGRIFLFGEAHGNQATMLRQIEIWGDFYHNYGMRHLFVELPYFAAQFLNMWMQADDDTILYELFEDWRGTAAHTTYKLDFYRAIKRDFPETVFHGNDVGHQSNTTGQRFLEHLRDNGLQGTPSYYLTLESMAQFTRFHNANSHAVRAYYKPRNFIRAFDALVDQDVMAIHGMGHVLEDAYFLGMEGVDTMATTLRLRYGDQLETFDMTGYARTMAIRIEVITIGDTEFYATFYGKDYGSFVTPSGRVVGREFWRVHDAYEHFATSSLNGNVLPLINFIMYVELGEVLVVDIHMENGDVRRTYYRTSGRIWNNMPVAEEFLP